MYPSDAVIGWRKRDGVQAQTYYIQSQEVRAVDATAGLRNGQVVGQGEEWAYNLNVISYGGGITILCFSRPTTATNVRVEEQMQIHVDGSESWVQEWGRC